MASQASVADTNRAHRYRERNDQCRQQQNQPKTEQQEQPQPERRNMAACAPTQYSGDQPLNFAECNNITIFN